MNLLLHAKLAACMFVERLSILHLEDTQNLMPVYIKSILANGVMLF